MKPSLSAITASLALIVAATVAYAGDDVTSLSYISYLERYATVHPGHGGETLDAVVNMPVLAGDRLDTARGARVEVQLSDGSTVWLDEFSTLDFDAMSFSRDSSASETALYLTEGTAVVEIPATAAGEGTMRFDSPSGTLDLNRPGLYRLELRSGEMRVMAYTGLAELPAGVGSALLRAGEEATIGEGGRIDKAALSDRTDDFWNWVQERRHPAPTDRTAEVVDTHGSSRAAVLDSYGEWVYVSDFSSWMWRPHVSAGWVPYSCGRWYWTTVGWNWISYEPWGWYPFHYGSWYLDASFGWVWGWDSVWAPAWVHWIYTPGYVGWCPRGYYDWWYMHHGHGGGPHGSPGRWSSMTFEFAGRVHLGAIDPRPWTIVPSGQFGSTHLERVRLEPSRFLRERTDGPDGFVRSGTLATPPPSRGLPDRGVDLFFRGGPSEREVPDLSTVLRREPGSEISPTVPPTVLRPARTAELAGGTRTQLPGTPGITRTTQVRGAREIAGDGWRRQGSGDRAPVVVNRPSERVGGRGNPNADTRPPTGRREIVRRSTDSGTSTTPRADAQPPRQPVSSTGRGDSPSTSHQGAPPANPRPPRNNATSWVRERNYGPLQGVARGWERRGGSPTLPMYPGRSSGWARTAQGQPFYGQRTAQVPRSWAPRSPSHASAGARSFSAPSGSSGFSRPAPVTHSSPRPSRR